MLASHRNSIKDMLLLPVFLFKNPFKVVQLFTRQNSLLILLYSHTMLFLSAYLIVADGAWNELWGDPFLKFLLAVNIASLVGFVLTSLPWLLFLGEAERYCQYTVPAAAMLFVVLAARQPHAGAWIIGLLLLHVCLIVLNLLVTGREAVLSTLRLDSQKDLQSLSAALDQCPSERLLTCPIKLSFALSALGKGHHNFYYRGIMQPDGTMSYMVEDTQAADTPRSDLEHFQQRYGITLFVVKKSHLAFAELHGVRYELTGHEVLYENDAYIVYRLSQPDSNESAKS
jgi:hypothetical protein